MDMNTLTTLTAMADQLPRFYQTRRRTLTGAELLEMGFSSMEGRSVEPQGKYQVPIRVQTNHVRILTRVFHRSGMEGVLELVQRYTPANAIAQ